MGAHQSRSLRAVVITLLVLLAVEFEMGIETNLSGLPSLSPVSISVPNILDSLNQAGVAPVLHAALGTILTILALLSLIMALTSRNRRVQVFGGLGFLTMCLAEITGVLFVGSGYQNDNMSRGMATSFLLTFAFYFVELYFLRPPARTVVQPAL